MSDNNSNITAMLEEIFKSRSHYTNYFKDGLDLGKIIEMELDWYRMEDDNCPSKKKEKIKMTPKTTNKLLISHSPGPKLNYHANLEMSNSIFDNIKSTITIEPLDLILLAQKGINSVNIPIIVNPSTYKPILKDDSTITTVTLDEYVALVKTHTGKHVRVDNPDYQKLEDNLIRLKEIHDNIGKELDRILLPPNSHQLKFPLGENFYAILMYNSAIAIFNSNNVIIKTFVVPFAKTCAIQFDANGEVDSYIIGTLYGVVIIYNSDFKIRSVLFLDGSVLKIRVTNGRFTIITSNRTCIFASNKNYDILVYEILHSKEAILDADIFGDTMACVTSTYGPTFNHYIKIYSIGKSEIESKIQLSNGRMFIKMNGGSDIKLSPEISTTGKRIRLNKMFDSHYSHNLTRQWIGLFSIDLIHFNYRRVESKFELYVSIVDYNNNHVIISFF